MLSSCRSAKGLFLVSRLSKLSNTFSVVNHYLYAPIPMLGNVPYPPVAHPSMIHPRMYVS